MSGFTKSLKNKLLIVLITVFAVCACAVAAFAPTGAYSGVLAETEKSLTINISEETVRAGETAEVKLSFENNTGIASVNLEVFYGEELTLEKVEFNKNLDGGNSTSDFIKKGSPVTLIWVNGFENFTGDEFFATLYFKLSETAEEDCFCEVYAEFNPDNIYDKDENLVKLTVISGGVSVTNAVAGDVNGDGVVNNKDVTRLFQYLAKWEVSVGAATVDVNGDGVVNNKDVTRLFQYLAKWEVEAHVTKFFKVTFEGNGGTLVSGEEVQKVKEKKSATAPEYEREGYEFIGFDKDFSCVTKRMTVTAQWKAIAPHEHTFATEWSSDGAFHWRAATCEHTEEVADKSAHEYVRSVDTVNNQKVYTCSVCGKIKTEALVDYGEEYNKYNELGKTVNLITASDLEVYTGAKSVFRDDMRYEKPAGNNTGTSYGNTIKSSSAEETLHQVHNAISVKVEYGSRKKRNGNFMTNKAPTFSFNGNFSYEKKRKTETNEYYYTYSYYYEQGSRSLNAYNSIEGLRQFVSDELLVDAYKLQTGQLTAAQFVSYWGTHVITAAIYGQRVDVNYSYIAEKTDDSDQWKANIEGELNKRFGFKQITVGGKVEGEKIETKITSDIMQKLDITSKSLNKLNATSLEQFDKNFDSWLQDKEGNVFINVPDQSLYWVWDLLGDEYNDVKELLDDYVMSECDKLNDEVLNKINSLKYEDDLKFDKNTQTLFLNLKYYQEHSYVGVDTFDRGLFAMTDGVLEITPYYNGTPIKKIVIEGTYGQRNMQGQIIDFVVQNFALKFDKDFDQNLIIELNNAAFGAPNNTACFDFSSLTNKNIQVEVSYSGKNKLSGGGGTSAQGVFEAKDVDIDIVGSAGAELVLCGGNGADGVSFGENGKDGAAAITAHNLTVNTLGKLEIHGGSGGNGKDGEGFSSNNSIKGMAGGNGGNGAVCANCESINVVKAFKVLFIAGNGGNGGNGAAMPNTLFWNGDGGNGGNAGKILAKIDGDCSKIEQVFGGKGNGGKKGTGKGRAGKDGIDGIGYHSETSFNGHRYILMSGRLTWEETKAYAESIGGHLATITSAEENEALRDLAAASGYSAVWLGAENTSGSWKWVTEEEFSYSCWGDGEPSGGDEHCLSFYSYGNYKWNDYNNANSEVVSFMVEFE